MQLEAIEVNATREPAAQEISPQSSLKGTALQQRGSSTLGATLQDELGVANASFGPNVGLPVIRGQQGPRTRVMINGVGNHDVSAMSPDHGTTVEALLAKEIRVLRGPATIRNGGGAIGGAVEIIDGRIPERIPTRSSLNTQVRHGSNHDEDTVVSELNTSFRQLALHADLHGRNSNDIEVPGAAIDQAAITRLFYAPSPSNTRGYTGNTSARSHGGSVGASLFGEQGYIGVSLSRYASNYGIPLGPAHSHGGAVLDTPEAVRIDMQQERLDLKGDWFIENTWLESLSLRVGKSRYQHDELSNGQPQTRFNNDAVESRLELKHHLGSRLSGSVGLHDIRRDFSALGSEAFVPQSHIRTSGVYLVETLDLQPWQLEFGWRKEKSELQAAAQRIWFTPTLSRTIAASRSQYAPESFSLALKRSYQSGSLTLNRWIARRAPDIQEVAAFGPHLATRTYDIGNRNLETETLNGWDLQWQQTLGQASLKLNLYQYQARDYIYQQNVGTVYTGPYFRPQLPGTCTNPADCLSQMQYAQQDARFHGYEFELGRPWKITGLKQLHTSVFADMVQGKLDDGYHVPRLAPGRYGVAVQASVAEWQGELRLTHGRAQQRTGSIIQPTGVELEPGTASYNKLDIYLRRPFAQAHVKGEVFVNMRNLGNAEIRNSTSFLRYYTPEMGRNIEIGMRLEI